LYARDRATVAVGESLNEITPTIEFIDADPDVGFNYPYYLYISERSEGDDELPLLVEPNNTGTGSDDFETHRERAEETIGRLSSGLAAELNVPTLVPVFPRPREEPVDWRHYTQQLDDYTLAALLKPSVADRNHVQDTEVVCSTATSFILSIFD